MVRYGNFILAPTVYTMKDRLSESADIYNQISEYQISAFIHIGATQNEIF